MFSDDVEHGQQRTICTAADIADFFFFFLFFLQKPHTSVEQVLFDWEAQSVAFLFWLTKWISQQWVL